MLKVEKTNKSTVLTKNIVEKSLEQEMGGGLKIFHINCEVGHNEEEEIHI